MARQILATALLPVLAVFLSLTILLPAPAEAYVTAFRQAIAEGVAEHDEMAAFYRDRDFEPIWTDEAHAERRQVLLSALENAAHHGLPTGRYDPDALRAAFRDADNPYTRGRAEIMASAMFLQYANDVQSGILDPGTVIRQIHRDPPRRDPAALLAGFTSGDPHGLIRSLPPAHPEYLRLQRALLTLQRMEAEGGWGPAVYAGRLERGDRGQGVLQLRDRLIRMGYMDRSVTAVYDAEMEAAVERFQANHGLLADGVAGPAPSRKSMLVLRRGCGRSSSRWSASAGLTGKTPTAARAMCWSTSLISMPTSSTMRK